MKYNVTKNEETGVCTARFNNGLSFHDFAKFYGRRLSLAKLLRNTCKTGLVLMGLMVLVGIQSGTINSFDLLRAALFSPELCGEAIMLGLIYGLAAEAVEQHMGGLLELERWLSFHPEIKHMQ